MSNINSNSSSNNINNNNKLNLDKLLSRLTESKQISQNYQVLQTYKTIYFRCIKVKEYFIAFNYLIDGCEYFYQQHLWNDGADLLKIIMKMLRDKHLSIYNEEVFHKMKLLFPIMQTKSVERGAFVTDMIDLIKTTAPSNTTTTSTAASNVNATTTAANASSSLSSTPTYSPSSLLSSSSSLSSSAFPAAITTTTTTTTKLSSVNNLLNQFNEFIGQQLWKERRYIEARPYLLRSQNGFVIGCFLVEIHRKLGYQSELDLFITQAIFQCLCMQQQNATVASAASSTSTAGAISVAALAFCTYTRRHPQLVEKDAGPPFLHFPLLNFVWFLMLAIDARCDLTVFHCLCEKYSHCIERDPIYANYLQKIAILYFNMPPPINRVNNSLPGQDLFASLFRLFGDDVGAEEDFDMNNLNDPLNAAAASASSSSSFLKMQMDEMD